MAQPVVRTALLLPVPAAEAVVDPWRRRFDPAASWGVPAHVTLLYPFVPPAALEPGVVDKLATLFADRAPVSIALSEARRFGDRVLYLAPEPAEPIRALTDAIVAAFPGCRPYGGRFDEVVPHLTLTDGAPAGVMAAAETGLASRLPIRCLVQEVWLMAGSDEPGSWRVMERFPLGR